MFLFNSLEYLKQKCYIQEDAGGLYSTKTPVIASLSACLSRMFHFNLEMLVNNTNQDEEKY